MTKRTEQRRAAVKIIEARIEKMNNTINRMLQEGQDITAAEQTLENLRDQRDRLTR